MKKTFPFLPVDHQEKINFAVLKALNLEDWKFINLLSGGLTGTPVYRIEVAGKSYAIKLENPADEEFDLHRSYKILETVSNQKISPKVYFTDADQGIILMQYIESQPRPEAPPKTIKKIAEFIRKLHEIKLFPKWKSVSEILETVYQRLPSEYIEKNIIKNCMQKINEIKDVLFDPKDIRSSHCDLNPVNILFDGNNYFFVDWQAASPQSLYFDLAYYANWFYFYSDDQCALFLRNYLEREPTKEEDAKYYLMRVFVYIYLGIGFISLPLKENENFPVLSEEAIENLPSYLEFMQCLGSGEISLEKAYTQQEFGFILLKTATEMMGDRLKDTDEVLKQKRLV